MRILFKWVLSVLSILFISYLTPDTYFYVSDLGTAFWAVAVISILNFLIFWILVLPIRIIFLFILDFFIRLIINTVLFNFAANNSMGLYIRDFGAAFWCALFYTVFNMLLYRIFLPGRKKHGSKRL